MSIVKQIGLQYLKILVQIGHLGNVLSITNNFWQQALNQNILKTCEWTENEDLLLKQAALDDMNTNKNWVEISKMVPGRTAYQCNLRWRRSLICQEEVVEVI